MPVAVLTSVLVQVPVYVNVLTGVSVKVFAAVFVLVTVYVYVGVFTGVLVNVFEGVLVKVYVGVRETVGEFVGVIAMLVRSWTLSTSMSSAPFALLAHCSATIAFWVKVDAVPYPRWLKEAALIGTVTFVHAAGAVNETPKLSPSVIDGCVNWNQYVPPFPFTQNSTAV